MRFFPWSFLESVMATVTSLLEINNDLLRLIYVQLGGTPLPPSSLKTAAPLRVPGQNVTVTFSWDPAADAGVTAGYRLDIFAPDGSLASTTALGLVTTIAVLMPDDTATYTANLTALAADGTESDPATVSFVPHTVLPPPTKPGTPTGFTAAVS